MKLPFALRIAASVRAELPARLHGRGGVLLGEADRFVERNRSGAAIGDALGTETQGSQECNDEKPS